MFTQKFGATVYAGDTITHEVDGFVLTATIHADDRNEAPWEDADGHGPVSEWTTRSKLPGERVLCSDRSRYKYYDFAGAMAQAKRDGWGPQVPYRTLGQAHAAAVEADFKFLRDWCNDEWHYVGVSVTVTRNGIELVADFECALWGIESIAGDYCTEVACDHADEALDAARQTLASLVA